MIPWSQKLAQLNDAYSGTAQVALIQDVALTEADPLATWLASEVANYQGSARQTITWATATTLDGASASVSFVPTTGAIACRYAILISGSRLMHIYDFGSGFSIPTSGITITYTPRFS